MDEEEHLETPWVKADKELDNWLPPELIERARVAAERDALTAERISSRPAKGKKRKKEKEPDTPPEARNPHFALIVTVLCLLIYLAEEITKALTDKGRAGYITMFSWISAAFSILVYLKFIAVRRHHKPGLALLLTGSLGFGLISALLGVLAENDQTRRYMGLAAAAFALVISPSFWLLYGLLRRRSTEKRAGLVQLAMLAILLIALLISALGRLLGRLQQGTDYNPGGNLITPERILSFLHGIGFLLLAMNWPVLDRPILPMRQPKLNEKPIQT